MTIVVPAKLAHFHAKHQGEAGRAWIRALPALASSYLRRWELRLDGSPRHGMVALVLPVRRADGTPAALKLQHYDPEHHGEAAALRAWAGDGMVRLLDSDVTFEREVLLLERLHADRPLSSVPDDDARVRVIGALLARLNAHPAPPDIRTLREVVDGMLDSLPALADKLTSAEERAFLRTIAAHTAEVAVEPGDRLLHWDLHYDNVLAGEREPWLGIDAKPLRGDPGFELLPALHNEIEGVNLERVTLRRFDILMEITGQEPHRAAAWTLARVLQNCLWEIEDGSDRLVADQVVIGRTLLAHRM